jgi:hypothetical protein
VLHPQFPPDLFLEGATIRQSRLSRDHQGPRAVLNALERLLGAPSNERFLGDRRISNLAGTSKHRINSSRSFQEMLDCRVSTVKLSACLEFNLNAFFC